MLPMGGELPLCSTPNGGHCQGVWLRFFRALPSWDLAYILGEETLGKIPAVFSEG